MSPAAGGDGAGGDGEGGISPWQASSISPGKHRAASELLWATAHAMHASKPALALLGEQSLTCTT